MSLDDFIENDSESEIPVEDLSEFRASLNSLKTVGLTLGVSGCEPENCKEKVWLWCIRALHLMLLLLWFVDLWDNAAQMNGSVLWNRSVLGMLHVNSLFNSYYFNTERNIGIIRKLVRDLSKIVRNYKTHPWRSSLYRYVSITVLGMAFLAFTIRLVETFYVRELKSVALGTQHILVGLLLYGSLYYSTVFMGVVFYQLNLIINQLALQVKEKPMPAIKQHTMLGRFISDRVNKLFGIPILLMNVTIIFLTLDLLFTLNHQVSNEMWLSTYVHSLSGIIIMMIMVKMACRISESSETMPNIIYDLVVTRRITSKTAIHNCDLFLANFDTFSIRAWEDIRLDRKLILIFSGLIGLYTVVRAQRLANSVPLYMLTNFDGKMAFVKGQLHHHPHL